MKLLLMQKLSEIKVFFPKNSENRKIQAMKCRTC